MTRISLLGQPSADVDGATITGIERNPKKLAVLACLALQPADKYVTRENLLALFWPESPERAGRHALSQSLHYIRHHFGAESVTSSGPHLLRLNATAVSVDVRDFARAFDAGDWEGAARLYGGDLLDGLTLDDAEAADWLDRERQQLRARAAQAFWQTAGVRLRAGDVDAAREMAERAIACDPTREVACRRLLDEAVACGRNRFAREIATSYAAALARATDGDTPNPAFLSFVEQLPAQADEAPLEFNAVHTEQVIPPALPARVRWLRSAVLVASAAALVFMTIRYVTIGPALGSADQTVATEFVIAQMRTDEDLRGLTDAVDGLSAERLRQFGWRVTLAKPGARLPELGYSLEERAYHNGGSTEFSYRVKELSSGDVVAAGALKFDGPLQPSEIATELTLEIRRKIGRSQRVLGPLSANVRSDWAHVWQQQMLGDSLRSAGAFSEAATVYRAADATYRNTNWPAKLALLVGVQHTKLLENYAIAASLQGNSSVADSLFERAIALADELAQRYPDRVEPIDARATVRYARSAFTDQPTLALLDEAKSDLQALVQRPGASAAAFARLSGVLFRKGEFDAARAVADEAAQRDVFLTSDNEILVQKFQALFNLEDDARAQAVCDTLNVRFPKEWPSAGCRLLLMGWTRTRPVDVEEADRLVREGAARESRQTQQVMTPRLDILRAGVLARAGQPDRALEILKRIDHSRDPELLAVKAAVYALLGDTTEARALARAFGQRNEPAQLLIEHGRLFRRLNANARSTSRSSAQGQTQTPFNQ